jgi:hypothetical protein
MVDFLQVAEVVLAKLGWVPGLLLVGSIPVVGFLWVAAVVPAELRFILVLKKVVWN